MDLFAEIQQLKKDFPKGKTITEELGRQSFNFYQTFAIGLFILIFFLGIFFGNLFATCQTSSFFYSTVTQFNFSVMILVWFLGFLLSTFIFAIGQIIEYLRKIDEKLAKFKS